MTTTEKNILQSTLNESKTVNEISGFKNQKAFNFNYRGNTFTVWHINEKAAKNIFDWEIQEYELNK